MTDTNSDWSIRSLNENDFDQWLPLWQGYLTYYESSVSDQVTDTTWSRIITPGEQPHGLCVVDPIGRLGGIVHYLFHRSTWTETSYCYLEDLFVDPAIRGQGLGGRLIAAVEQMATEEGATRLYWNTQHFNTRARVLYDRVSTLSPFIQYRTSVTG
ncbi:MAG: GNAT family N-acetyltransferase [Pseudomonadota bacterium]